ncbi:MAG: OmpA family protein [Thermodesulfobacteriota bacterium]
MGVSSVSRLLVCVSICWVLCTGGAQAADQGCDKAKRQVEYANKYPTLSERSTGLELAAELGGELCPSDPSYRVALGKAFLEIAIAYFEDWDATVAAKKPQTRLLNRYNDNLDRSTEQFEKALSIDGTHRDALTRLVANYCQQGRLEAALGALKPWLAKQPVDPDLKTIADSVKKAHEASSGGFKKAQEIAAEIRKAGSEEPQGQSAEAKPAAAKKISAMGFTSRTITRNELAVLNKVKDRRRFDNITFREWSHELVLPKAQEQVAELGRALNSKSLDRYTVIVEGHTDNRGDPRKNKELSEKRAAEVRQYLIDRIGISPDRVTAQGFGLSRPKVPNDSDTNRSLNRRVEVIFVE